MPALVAFGRRWQVASDDFVFPGFMDVLFRISCLIGGSIIYWQEESKLSCQGGHFMRNYLWGNTILLLLILFADIGLVQSSMNGTIMDTDARRLVRPFLYLRCFLEIPEIAWNILGTIWVFTTNIICDQAPETLFLIKSLVIVNWVVVLILIIFVFIVFDPSGSKTYDVEMDYDRFRETVLYGGGYNRSQKIWERRCKFILCSCIGGDEIHRTAFKDVGRIMAFVFDQEIDLVPTDIAAGLIVINLRAQAEANLAKSRRGVSSAKPFLLEESLNTTSLQNMEHWISPTAAAHFMKYALASYGWPWFLVANPRTGLLRLWENILCCGCFVSHPCSVEGDNCCYCHTSALKQTTLVDDSDLWYASFHNSVFQTPFFAAIDHTSKSVVVAIRGTMSLRDAVTDLTAEAKVIEGTGVPVGCKAHYGMILAARHILQKLNSLRLLERARRELPDYTLVLTGHSLGAGAATILSFLLRSQYPDLKCYAYSPPGGLLSKEASEYSESFVLSVVVGDDIVSRLSVPSLEKFKQKLIRSVKECKAPKYRIVVGGCWYLLVGGIPRIVEHEGPEDEEQDIRSDTVLLQQEQPNYHTYVSLAEVSQKLQRESVTRCPMYIPGKIMHVIPKPVFDSRPDLQGESDFEWRWADKEEFSEIRVTPKMMIDHYPDNVFKALSSIASSAVPMYL